MAEQDTEITPQYTTDVTGGESQSTARAQVPVCDELKQEETDSAQNIKHQLSQDAVPLSASTYRKTESDKGEEMEQAEFADNAVAKEETHLFTEGPSHLDMNHELNVEKNFASAQISERRHDDNSGESQRNDKPTIKADELSENPAVEQKALELNTSPAQSDRMDEQEDGHTSRIHEDPPAINKINTGAGEDDGKSSERLLALEEETNVTSPQTLPPQETSTEKEAVEQRNDVETVGPEETSPKHAVSEDTRILGGNMKYLFLGIVVVLVAVLAHYVLHPEPLPEKQDVQQIDIFLQQLEKVKTQFPSQRPELWRRSRIHLERHLLTARPTEPSLASAFSSALNASVLHINGSSKASQDSDQVKLDIDTQLQGAFEGDKPVAVIHRFEELPPGSTLIFYRYCDHENAAYKKTLLIFTVLLGGEEELPAQLSLSVVEEMVDDHLQKKFLSYGHPVAFDKMDLDKYGGLWSRISHLILPVAAEERIKHEGC
ncbi:hypothetical protein LDENG_00294570 [Lucifuga dentata]|nr:hypothetical protein LDENG_00294570 [Lucifuga dentata]